MVERFLGQAHGVTDAGTQRDHNEDAVACFPDDGLFVVTDGMGGSRSGDIASQIAIATMPEGFRAGRDLPGAERLASAVKLANQRILEKATKDRSCSGVGACIAALSVVGDNVQVAHVGDCRVYRYHRLELTPLTRDHTLVNDYRAYKPDLTEAEIAALPQNVITRGLGFQEDVAVDVKEEPARAGAVYLLCSDGLYRAVSDARIAEILREHAAVEPAARALLEEALAQRTDDNVTCLVVRLSLR